MKLYTTEPGKYPDDKPQNTDTEYFGTGWSVKATDGKFILTYISGALQGQLETVEITKEDYALARNGKLGHDAMCTKYNVY